MKYKFPVPYILIPAIVSVFASLATCAPGGCDRKDEKHNNPDVFANALWNKNCDDDLFALRQRLAGCGAGDTAVDILKERFEPCKWIEKSDRDTTRCLIDCFAAQPDVCGLLFYSFNSCLCETRCGLPCLHACAPGDFQCDDGHCLPFYAECDFFNDCLDASDEAGACQTKCVDDGGFICDDGPCVPADFECDYFFDCADHSDEHQACIDACVAGGGFSCTDGFCVPAAWRCDGQNDCPDWSDEAGCE